MKKQDILSVKNLSVSFLVNGQSISIIDDVSFSLKSGETMALVGESGCGKTVTIHAILRLLPIPAARITSGNVIFKDTDILNLPESALPNIRGKAISLIFQDALQALNPVKTIRKQLEEIFLIHRKELKKKEYNKILIDILKKVDFEDTQRIMNAYPHELSGGMQQRVMIAMALAANPEIIIADEPTTSLDINAQLYIIKLLKKIQNNHNISIIFVSHDMNIVKNIADSIAIMYAGQIVEYGDAREVLTNCQHPYTKEIVQLSLLSDKPPKSILPIISGTQQIMFSENKKQCRFFSRCKYAQNRCNYEKPKLIKINDNHFLRCYCIGCN